MIHNVVNPDETLTIPETFKPVRRKLLVPPWPDFQWNWSFVQDMTVNLLGFIPAGFFFAALLLRATRQKRLTVYVITAILGAGLSLFIELTQAWLPTRDSSLTDMVCNAAGTILGIAIYHVLQFRREFRGGAGGEFRGQYN
jgi:glycopeptide antibiotics resistance protein